MKSVILKTLWLLLVAALVFPAGSLLAQGTGQGQQQQQQPPTPPTPPGQPAQPATPPPPVVNKEEEDAYKAFYEARGKDPQLHIQMGEEFLKKFPESRYLEAIYSLLAHDYLNTDQADKMFVAGEKALALGPNNIDVLALMAWGIPRRVNTQSLDADQKLQKAETYAKQGLTLLQTWEKPATMTEEDFTKAKNDKAAMCHSGLGFVDFLRGRYADSAAELDQAAKLAPNPDPVDFFVLGLAQQNAKHFPEAIAAFERCGQDPGPMQARCKQALEGAKKAAAAQPAPPKP